MKKNHLRSIIAVGILLAVTIAGMAYSKNTAVRPDDPPPTIDAKSGVVKISGTLTRGKVLTGGDGSVALSLTMTADDVTGSGETAAGHVDMVVVLDRSGSMGGGKIKDAKNAVIGLLGSLSEKDRFALVTYSNDVIRNTNLMVVTPSNREKITRAVHNVFAGGGTNLGSGLQEGINVLSAVPGIGNPGRIILISDGLANQGITHPDALGRMASTAVTKEYTVSTVGVGADFNEQLMTTIADHGTGNYHYLDDASRFAEVFEKEFMRARVAAATGVEIHVPLSSGVTLVGASGYPVRHSGNMAVIRPGDLLSGRSRTIYLNFSVPTSKAADYEIKNVRLTYNHGGEKFTAAISKPFMIACVQDEKAVYASYDKDQWENKVIQEDYNRLREEVALEIKKGDKKKAKDKIDEYRTRQQAINATVKSEAVTSNLNDDLRDLEGLVDESFEGPAEEAAQKQKTYSKELQHKGYGKRRSLF